VPVVAAKNYRLLSNQEEKKSVSPVTCPSRNSFFAKSKPSMATEKQSLKIKKHKTQGLRIADLFALSNDISDAKSSASRTTTNKTGKGKVTNTSLHKSKKEKEKVKEPRMSRSPQGTSQLAQQLLLSPKAAELIKKR
jgi:hypothetical protein